jgi:hypothetical protein
MNVVSCIHGPAIYVRTNLRTRGEEAWEEVSLVKPLLFVFVLDDPYGIGVVDSCCRCHNSSAHRWLGGIRPISARRTSSLQDTV